MDQKDLDKLWEDEKNWGGGLCGWYFCKEDPRLWVPKKIKSMGITVNLGHPKGGATLVTLFLMPTIILAVTLVAVIFTSL
jgi:uncharacterized membrane protein